MISPVRQARTGLSVEASTMIEEVTEEAGMMILMQAGLMLMTGDEDLLLQHESEMMDEIDTTEETVMIEIDTMEEEVMTEITEEEEASQTMNQLERGTGEGTADSVEEETEMTEDTTERRGERLPRRGRD